MLLPKKWLRKWRAKGHGIHSPFAFQLITNVLYSPYAYNAFFDIKNLLSKNNINPECIDEFNYLSFRLTHHFNPKNILEIGSEKGINTLFLAAAHRQATITCIESNDKYTAVAKKLLQKYSNQITFNNSLNFNNDTPKFDAIFVNTRNNGLPNAETLFTLSNERTFWVFYPLKQKTVKPLIRNIVKDKRVRTVFDMKKTNILFLDPSYHKTEYYI